MPSWWAGGKKNKLTPEYLSGLCGTVVKYFENTNNVRQDVVVEAVRQMAEIIVWGDIHDEKIFYIFLEKNMLPFLTELLCMQIPSEVKIQLTQTLYILVQNLKSHMSIFYLLSENHINNLIMHDGLGLEEDEELLNNFINFLKSLSLRLDVSTIQCFYNRDTDTFPLYTASSKFLSHQEALVRTAARAIVVHMCKVEDDYVLNYVVNTAEYLKTVFRIFKDQLTKLDSFSTRYEEAMNHLIKPDAFPAVFLPPTLAVVGSAIEDVMDDMYYFNDLLQLKKPKLLYSLYLHTLEFTSLLSASIHGDPRSSAAVPRYIAATTATQWILATADREFLTIIIMSLCGFTPKCKIRKPPPLPPVSVKHFDTSEDAAHCTESCGSTPCEAQIVAPQPAKEEIEMPNGNLSASGSKEVEEAEAVAEPCEEAKVAVVGDESEKEAKVAVVGESKNEEEPTATETVEQERSLKEETVADIEADSVPQETAPMEEAEADSVPQEEAPKEEAPKEETELKEEVVPKEEAEADPVPQEEVVPEEEADADSVPKEEVLEAGSTREEVPENTKEDEKEDKQATEQDEESEEEPLPVSDGSWLRSILEWSCEDLRHNVTGINLVYGMLEGRLTRDMQGVAGLIPRKHQGIIEDKTEMVFSTKKGEQKDEEPAEDSDMPTFLTESCALPAVPQCEEAEDPADYVYSHVVVGQLLLWLCHAIRAIPRCGRLETFETVSRCLVELVGTDEPVQLSKYHACLLRDLYRTSCCILRRRFETIKEEIHEKPAQQGVVKAPPPLTGQAQPAATQAASASTTPSPRSRGSSVTKDVVTTEGRAIMDPLEVLFLYLSNKVPQHRDLSNSRPKHLLTRPSLILPLLDMSSMEDSATPPPSCRPSLDIPESPGSAADSAPASPLAQKPIAEPGAFRVIGKSGAMVRQDEAMDSKLLVRLKQHCTVEIVEIRHRRCRISRPVEGWISMWNSVGETILQRILPEVPEKEAGKMPEWLVRTPLEERCPCDEDELAKVEAVAFLLIRKLIFKLAGRENTLEECLKVPDNGLHLKHLGEDIGKATIPGLVRCQLCPQPWVAQESQFASKEFNTHIV